MSTETIAEVQEGTTLRTYMELLNAHYAVQDLPGLKFALKVADNIKKLEANLEPVSELLKPSEEFQEFASRVHLECQGDSVKIAAMEAANQELVDQRHDQLTAGQTMLDSTFEIKLRHFNADELPKTITARQYLALDTLIN